MNSGFRGARVRLLAALGGALLVGAVLAQSDEERALEQVRGKIEAVEQRLARQSAERDERMADLKRIELAIAASSGELGRIQARLGERRARREALAGEIARANDGLDSERAALVEQIRLSYMTGREELLKLLLSQESPATLGRMLAYYDYFNRARAERIAAVRTELDSLQQLSAENTRVEQELAALESARERELATQQAARDERRGLVRELDAAIAADGSEVGRLREEEKRLADLVVELSELLSAFPRNLEEPFTAVKGKLAWPVPGQIANDFGEPRGGGRLRWNGVVLRAARGTVVRAVYHGRIAFSDWLPGLGLLIIVDHGDGYMSLYGQNEALLAESGDWVTPGEPIAEVGDSGGRPEPSLYFEIRHDGEPVNPHPWMAEAPAGK
jgi:septal ring factor EnvC (AmiA/AmiB activator)